MPSPDRILPNDTSISRVYNFKFIYKHNHDLIVPDPVVPYTNNRWTLNPPKELDEKTAHLAWSSRLNSTQIHHVNPKVLEGSTGSVSPCPPKGRKLSPRKQRDQLKRLAQPKFPVEKKEKIEEKIETDEKAKKDKSLPKVVVKKGRRKKQKKKPEWTGMSVNEYRIPEYSVLEDQYVSTHTKKGFARTLKKSIRKLPKSERRSQQAKKQRKLAKQVLRTELTDVEKELAKASLAVSPLRSPRVLKSIKAANGKEGGEPETTGKSGKKRTANGTGETVQIRIFALPFSMIGKQKVVPLSPKSPTVSLSISKTRSFEGSMNKIVRAVTKLREVVEEGNGLDWMLYDLVSLCKVSTSEQLAETTKVALLQRKHIKIFPWETLFSNDQKDRMMRHCSDYCHARFSTLSQNMKSFDVECRFHPKGMSDRIHTCCRTTGFTWKQLQNGMSDESLKTESGSGSGCELRFGHRGDLILPPIWHEEVKNVENPDESDSQSKRIEDKDRNEEVFEEDFEDDDTIY